MKRRVIATIYFNTDKYGSRHRTGAFDFAEFAKLMQDFDGFRKAPTEIPTPYCYGIYSLDDPSEGEELCFFFHEVERINPDG